MVVVEAVSVAGGRAANEDHFLAADSWALVLDGITRYPEDGCVHDVPWYVRCLGAAIGARIGGGGGLREVLADAIGEVRGRHESTCELGNPVTPGATAGLVRRVGERIEWLVLGDCAVAWRNRSGAIEVRSDDRVAKLVDPPRAVEVGGLRRYPVEYIARVRNLEGGFWVAASEPEAAAEALTGSVAVAEVSELLLCTDGLTRLVDRYGHSWPEVFARVAEAGVDGLIGLVREEGDRDARIGPKSKRHDDATVVRWRFG